MQKLSKVRKIATHAGVCAKDNPNYLAIRRLGIRYGWASLKDFIENDTPIGNSHKFTKWIEEKPIKDLGC